MVMMYLIKVQLALPRFKKKKLKKLSILFNIWVEDAPLYVDARKGYHLCLGEAVSQMKFTRKNKTMMVSQF